MKKNTQKVYEAYKQLRAELLCSGCYRKLEDNERGQYMCFEPDCTEYHVSKREEDLQ